MRGTSGPVLYGPVFIGVGYDLAAVGVHVPRYAAADLWDVLHTRPPGPQSAGRLWPPLGRPLALSGTGFRLLAFYRAPFPNPERPIRGQQR